MQLFFLFNSFLNICLSLFPQLVSNQFQSSNQFRASIIHSQIITRSPSRSPTVSPTRIPTARPTTFTPTRKPSQTPSAEPTLAPTPQETVYKMTLSSDIGIALGVSSLVGLMIFFALKDISPVILFFETLDISTNCIFIDFLYRDMNWLSATSNENFTPGFSTKQLCLKDNCSLHERRYGLDYLFFWLGIGMFALSILKNFLFLFFEMGIIDFYLLTESVKFKVLFEKDSSSDGTKQSFSTWVSSQFESVSFWWSPENPIFIRAALFPLMPVHYLLLCLKTILLIVFWTVVGICTAVVYCVVKVLQISFVFLYLVGINLVFYFSVLISTELGQLLFHFHPAHVFSEILIAFLFLVIQIIYASLRNRICGLPLTSVQIASMTFSGYHVGFVTLKKYYEYKEKDSSKDGKSTIKVQYTFLSPETAVSSKSDSTFLSI